MPQRSLVEQAAPTAAPVIGAANAGDHLPFWATREALWDGWGGAHMAVRPRRHALSSRSLRGRAMLWRPLGRALPPAAWCVSVRPCGLHTIPRYSRVKEGLYAPDPFRHAE